MSKSVFELRANESIFNEAFDEYDISIILAKDAAMSKLLKEISSYLYPAYLGLLKNGQTVIRLSEDSIYKEVSPILYAEAIDSKNCEYLRTDQTPVIHIKDYCIIKIIGADQNEEKIFEYEVIFSNDLSLIIIQDENDSLIMDLNYDFIIDSTYSENSIDAILHTLAFVVSSFYKVKTNVISLAEYKKNKQNKRIR